MTELRPADPGARRAAWWVTAVAVASLLVHVVASRATRAVLDELSRFLGGGG